MPISRYEIRNEYSLADPELYRAADKDDPEALLEGVAMAGLVGVLRQLGDLAEFAAEIFHDLHEEVMATAARGHSLTIRVQQLETEVPTIERAFLSQTDHSPFFYNSGVDWHPNLQMDQSLITRGDLPRFVMDSYEECRGPPRLFLLDKFDVAGAGACLKRYTDPSFFKFEASATNADIQREKKIRKPKKKGPRWRIGETPEVLPMSQHAKLHQLFLDDLVENGANKLPRRGKLKRRLTGFPFDSKTGKSYMEKLLRTPSPEHRVLEITASSPLQLPSDDHNESDHEVLEVRSVSPSRESVARKRSPPSPDGEEILLKPFMYVTNEVPNSYLNIATDNTPSISDEVSGEKDITIDRESKTESSLNGYESDEIASEIDNYVDAPSTMESEMDTDSELRVKNDFTSYNKREELISVETEEHHPQSSDSQSTGDLKLSDGNNSSKKETSSFSSSDSPNTSPEKPQSEEMSAEGIPSSDIPGIAIPDALPYHKSFHEDFPVDQLPKPVVSDNTCTDKDTRTNNRPDSEQLTSSSCNADSTTILVHYHSKRVRKGRLGGPYSDVTARNSNDEEKKIKQIVDSQSSPSVSYFKSRSGDNSLRFFSREHSLEKDNSLRYFSREHSLDEPNGANEPCKSVDSDIIRHSTDSSAATSVHLLHEDGYDLGDVNQVENTTSTLNMPNVLSQNRIDTAEMTSTKNPVTDKLDSEVPKLPENFPSDDSDHTDIAHNGDIVTPMISEGKQLNDVLEIEDSNIVSDVSLGKELLETSLYNAETVNPEEHYSNGSLDHQISSETLVLSPKECSPDFPDVEAHDDRVVIAEEEAAVNGTPQLQSPKSYEVDEFQDREKITDDVTPNDCALESSCHTPQHETSELESPKSCEVDELQGREKITDDVTPNDFVALDTPENHEDASDTGLEVTEISSPTDLEPLNEVHVQSDEADYQTDLSETEAMASSAPAVPDTAIRENVRLPVDVDKLVEEDTPCFEDSGPDALEKDKNSLPGSHVDSNLEEEDNHQLLENHRQPGLVDEVDEREATTSDLCTDSSEVSQTVPDSYLDSKFVDPTQIQSLEKSSIDTDQESIQQNSVENQVFDDTKEKMLQEKIELPPDQTDEDWLSLLPINDQKMLDDNDHKGDNNSVLSFSLDNYPPSVSEHPKDPLGFVFPPSNPFSETNEMNVDELPPLPPLPPVQWRMGKLQHTSSTTEEETMAHNKELFTQEIPFLTAASIDVNSEEMNRLLAQIVKEEKVDHGSSSLEANSQQETIEPPAEIENKHPQLLMPASESEVTSPAEEDVSSSLEEMNHSLDQIIKEEKVDHPGSSSWETNSMRDTIEPSVEIETKLPYLAMPVSKSEIMTPAEEDVSSSLEELNHSLTQNVKEEKVELERGSSSLEVNSMHETVDTPPEIENRHPYLAMPASKSEVTISPDDEDVSSSLEEMNDSLSQIVPESTLKEEKVGHETIDPPPEIENKHPQVFVPASKSEVTTPEEEDGFANRTQTKKLPLPRNPLVEDVSVLDKSKLRKVTERVIPQMQKVDERDSILEQIRAKSFSLKPAATSRPTIQGPKTNLNVAAILEKANAIRQAFAGSDDDDDDNWSDS